MNLVNQYNQKQLEKITEGKNIPHFKAGYTLRLHLVVPKLDSKSSRKTSEGSTRLQVFEGLCIARRNSGIGSTLTVRKVIGDQSVEKTLHLYSYMIDKIEVVKKGRVRRAKLYYMRNRKGKAARLVEIKDNK
jgi:large subunit ribosomal protein L19